MNVFGIDVQHARNYHSTAQRSPHDSFLLKQFVPSLAFQDTQCNASFSLTHTLIAKKLKADQHTKREASMPKNAHVQQEAERPDEAFLEPWPAFARRPWNLRRADEAERSERW